VRPAAALAAAALAAGGAAGCGTSHEAKGTAAAKPAAASVAADAGTIRVADCRYWNATDAAEHRSLLAAMRAFFGAEADNGQRGPVLSDQQAEQLFSGACRPAYAKAFKLYKLYGRAAAFTDAG